MRADVLRATWFETGEKAKRWRSLQVL